MQKKKFVITLGSLGSLSLVAVPLVSVSFISKKQINLKDIDMSSSTWISKFQSHSNTFMPSADGYWKLKESLLLNNKYEITYVGSISARDVFDLEVKALNKHYEIMFNNNPFNKNINKKSEIKTVFALKLISDFETKMISHKTFYNSIIVHDKKNLSIGYHGKINFHSSWGVYNSDSTTITAYSVVPPEKIHEAFKIAEKDTNNVGNIIYSNYWIYNINYVPLVQVISPPISTDTFTLSDMILNRVPISNSKSMHPSLPKGSQKGLEWWRGITSSIIPAISILGAPFSAGASLGIGIIAGGLEYHAGESIHVLTPQQINLINRLQENRINLPYFQSINVSSGIDITFFGTLSARANATSIFGNWSSMNLYDLYVAYNISANGDIYAK